MQNTYEYEEDEDEKEKEKKKEKKKANIPSLNEYYPQNDWNNYINLVNSNDIDETDRQFI